MFKRITLVILMVSFLGQAQNWMSHNDIEATGSINLHANANGVFYAYGLNGLTHSTDFGETWSEAKPIPGAPAGQAELLQGAHDRVYVKYKMTDAGNPGYQYYYTTDYGNTWVNDDDGLPSYYGMDVPGRTNFVFSELSSNYIAVHNIITEKSYYKKVGEEGWEVIQPYAFNALQGFTYVGDTWFAAIPTWAGRLKKSTDFGKTWTTVNYSGLPSGEIQVMASNHEEKLFVNFNGSNEIYMSEDEGETWVALNAAPVIAQAEGNLVANMKAHKDDLYVALGPVSTEDVTTNYIESHTAIPSFTVGDPSGLYETWLAQAVAEFFLVNDKVYVSYFELFSSEGGGENLALEDYNLANDLNIFPNPVADELTIYTSLPQEWRLYSINGELLDSGDTGQMLKSQISLSNYATGTYLLKVGSATKKLVKI